MYCSPVSLAQVEIPATLIDPSMGRKAYKVCAELLVESRPPEPLMCGITNVHQQLKAV